MFLRFTSFITLDKSLFKNGKQQGLGARINHLFDAQEQIKNFQGFNNFILTYCGVTIENLYG